MIPGVAEYHFEHANGKIPDSPNNISAFINALDANPAWWSIEWELVEHWMEAK
jgi:hypothetical protein